MTLLLLLPTFLCALIMGAHFLRDASIQGATGAPLPALWDLFMVLMCVALPFLLLIRRRVVLRMMQLLLALSALELLFTGYDIMKDRIASGNPDVLPPGIIMAGTAAFCLLAVGLYQTRRLKRRYPAETAATAKEQPKAHEKDHAESRHVAAAH